MDYHKGDVWGLAKFCGLIKLYKIMSINGYPGQGHDQNGKVLKGPWAHNDDAENDIPLPVQLLQKLLSSQNDEDTTSSRKPT